MKLTKSTISTKLMTGIFFYVFAFFCSQALAEDLLLSPSPFVAKIPDNYCLKQKNQTFTLQNLDKKASLWVVPLKEEETNTKSGIPENLYNHSGYKLKSKKEYSIASQKGTRFIFGTDFKSERGMFIFRFTWQKQIFALIGRWLDSAHKKGLINVIKALRFGKAEEKIKSAEDYYKTFKLVSSAINPSQNSSLGTAEEYTRQMQESLKEGLILKDYKQISRFTPAFYGIRSALEKIKEANKAEQAKIKEKREQLAEIRKQKKECEKLIKTPKSKLKKYKKDSRKINYKPKKISPMLNKEEKKRARQANSRRKKSAKEKRDTLLKSQTYQNKCNRYNKEISKFNDDIKKFKSQGVSLNKEITNLKKSLGPAEKAGKKLSSLETKLQWQIITRQKVPTVQRILEEANQLLLLSSSDKKGMVAGSNILKSLIAKEVEEAEKRKKEELRQAEEARRKKEEEKRKAEAEKERKRLAEERLKKEAERKRKEAEAKKIAARKQREDLRKSAPGKIEKYKAEIKQLKEEIKPLQEKEKEINLKIKKASAFIVSAITDRQRSSGKMKKLELTELLKSQHRRLQGTNTKINNLKAALHKLEQDYKAAKAGAP